MTDEQIIKGLECCHTHEGYCTECPYLGLEFCILTLNNDISCMMQRQKSEIERLTLTFAGVMHFVDKWLDGEELDKDEVTRAATMREKTLSIVEGLQAQLKTARADAVREFAERLLSDVVTFGDIERVLREMTEGEK